MPFKVFSTFTGIGGFEIGIQNASVGRLDTELVGYSEIDKYAIQVFEHKFKGVKNYGDITKIVAEDLPDFDCLVGGFPCQSFSISGLRKGFDDTRGTLFFDLARILRAKRPRLFVFENVKGLVNHDKGRTFATIIATITDLGYDCQWQVLNSKNFGVPQNRERVFIIGHLRGSSRPQVLPIRETTPTHLKDAVAFAYHNKRHTATMTPYSNTLSASFRGHPDGDGRPGIIQLNKPHHSVDRVYSPDGIAPTLGTMQGGGRQPFVKVPEATKKGYAEATEGDAINLSNPNSKTRRGKVGKGMANTLETSMLQYTLQSGLIRRLTPLECERLQGFPDNWTAEGVNEKGELVPMSDTQRYKLNGNAVTTKVVEAVFTRIFMS